MQDLKEVTHATHYENFRRQKLHRMVEQEVGIQNFNWVWQVYVYFLSKDEHINEGHKNNYDDAKFDGMAFNWEGAFGNLTNERLEQLQKYASDQDYVKKFSVDELPHERQIKEDLRYTNNKDKMVSSLAKF